VELTAEAQKDGSFLPPSNFSALEPQGGERCLDQSLSHRHTLAYTHYLFLSQTEVYKSEEDIVNELLGSTVN